jgi:hypothetical protein
MLFASENWTVLAAKHDQSIVYQNSMRIPEGCARPDHENIYGGRGYGSTHSSAQHYMEVSGKLHAPAALPPANEHHYPSDSWLGVLQSWSWRFGEEKRILSLPAFKPLTVQSCLVTTSAEVLPPPPRPTLTEHKSHTPRHKRLQYLSEASLPLPPTPKKRTSAIFTSTLVYVDSWTNYRGLTRLVHVKSLPIKSILVLSKAMKASTFPHKSDNHCYPVCEIWYGDSAQI